VSKVNLFVAETSAWVDGGLFCLFIIIGAYLIGRWLAPKIGWEFDPDSLGLLSAITFVWIYEHRDQHHKFHRLLELLGPLGKHD
jgi:hypothetical protein